eukprot:gnl/TRDRNA2_/TRDRNA2_133786_c0_seq2.p1 gnl/TRDRNA2_/TRDRNA2_133786_c0~~gnl/TRDRNA2_/TRDRNA2_133786_c0_seq2.p1  ORF type:complete len:123 (-),score=2.90 gnl/TRDRNA2_/TRDRNA2_133786_c0_seq2:260-628(-)
MLEERPGVAKRVGELIKITEDSERGSGFFGIGIIQGTRNESWRTLWRSAYQLGASFVFTVGARKLISGIGVTERKTEFRTFPAWRFDDFADFAACAPFAAPLVAIEMGGQPLETFEHPKCAV